VIVVGSALVEGRSKVLTQILGDEVTMKCAP
jgi:hypothetical protein